jgi:hypothetical protein
VAARCRFGLDDAQLKVRHCIAWRFYAPLVAALRKLLPKRIKRDIEFVRTGVRQGLLPRPVFERLRDALRACPAGLIRQEDFSITYRHHDGLRAFEKVLNSSHTYLQIERCNPEALRLTLEALSGPVTACLGVPWRTLNLRCWKTRPGATEAGPNAWHRDGFPSTALKLMVYLTGADALLGTTEIELKDGSRRVIEGPEGTWVLFQNGGLLHRGIAPTTGERVILEITLGPALKQDARPVFAGLNSAYPYYPWSRARAA